MPVLEPIKPAGLLQSLISQLHAGARIEGKVTFDIPGPFDPVVSFSAEVVVDAGTLKLRELHIKPAA